MSWAIAIAAGMLFANVYPIRDPRHTLGLTATHLPIALWRLADVGGACVGTVTSS